MWSGVQPSSSLWWTSAPYFTSSFTTSRFPVSTASCSAAIPAHKIKSLLCCSTDIRPVSYFTSSFKVNTVEALLTWVEERIHAHLPRSHEPTDLLQVPPPHYILEDDVIGEVHSPLCGCDGYHGCRTLLFLRALCWTVPWALAVRGDVRRRSLVGGREAWWRVVCRAVLCGRVLCRGGVWGCVVRRCVVWGGVIGRRVVHWRVLRAAGVRRHWHVVVVLHPGGGCHSASPFAVSPGGGTREIHEREHTNPNKEQYPLLRVPSPSSSLAYYPFSVQLGLPSTVAVEYKNFNPSFGLYAPYSLARWESLPSEVWNDFSHCAFTVAQNRCLMGQAGRGTLYTLCWAILGPKIQWLQPRNEWPSCSSSPGAVTCPLTRHPPPDHKKCWQPKCSLWVPTSDTSSRINI